MLNISKRSSLLIFLALCFNVAIAPVVYATTNDAITKENAYALGLLGIVIAGLAVYLSVVIFQPERF